MTDGDTLVYSSLESLLKQRSQARLLQRGRKNIHARQTGQHLSVHKGRGMDFAESRLYQPGDDVRLLDWRVTARTGKPHTKIFQEERERPVLLWVDMRPAMRFATRGRFKSVLAAEVASLISWRSWLEGDRVGGIIHAGNKSLEHQPRRSMSSVSRWLKQLSEHTRGVQRPVRKMDLSVEFEHLRRVAGTGSQVVIISDFRGFDEHVAQQLTGISRKSSLYLFPVSDPFEQVLPADVDGVRVTDSVKSAFLNFRKKRFARQYRDSHQARMKAVLSLARKLGVSCTPLSTSDSQTTLMMKVSRGLT